MSARHASLVTPADGNPEAEREEAIAAVVQRLVEVGRQMQTPRLTPFGDVQLTRTQLEALFVITHRPQVTPGSLASELSVTAGAVSQLMAGLREHGLVDTTPHPHDARSVILALTPEAQAEIQEFENQFIRAMAPRFSGLSVHHLRHLTQLLNAITAPEVP